MHILKLVKRQGGNEQKVVEAKVRHILISNEVPDAQTQITRIRNQILAGESFSKLAENFSFDKGSAVNGGELPMVNTSNYVPPFAAAANTLALNILSQPIQTRFGWHIIEVLERRFSDRSQLEIKDQAKLQVSEQKREEDFKSWLKSLRDEAFVEYRINL